MGKNTFAVIAAAAFLMQAAHGQTGSARTGNVAVTIDAGKTGFPSRHTYTVSSSSIPGCSCFRIT